LLINTNSANELRKKILKTNKRKCGKPLAATMWYAAIVFEIECEIMQHKFVGIRANLSWMLVGNVVYTASQWGILTVLTRLGDARTVGQFVLAVAITTPVIQLTSLQLRAVQATDANNRYDFHDFLSLRLIAVGIAFFIILFISLGGSYSTETCLVILLIGAAKIFESVSDIIW
jgi:hypothetical protein